MNQISPLKVLIVGGGFAGVKAARELMHNKHVQVTLLSKQPFFQYYPTLYHTATGGLRAQSSIPLAQLFDERITVVTGTATGLDRDHKRIVLEDGSTLDYDYLILGLGSVTNYFGIEGLKEYSYGIKSMEEVARFKKHLHDQLISEHKPDLNYVVVGAGPTGIELSGALPHYLRKIMQFHGIKRRAIHIDLVEAGPRLLPRSPARESAAVKRRLKRLGVKLYVGKTVEGLTADALTVSGKPITSHTVVWTAGVAVNPFFKEAGFTLAERGKVAVNEHLEAEDGIYVLGDDAATTYSGLAQTAVHDGKYTAEDISRRILGRDRPAYKPLKPITVIPSGENWASVAYGKYSFSGIMGWVLRSAADWIAFKDIEDWWPATEQWATEFGSEEQCTVCLQAARTR